MMVKRKLDGAVDESSADKEIRKSYTYAAVHNLWLAVRQAGSTADEIWVRLEIEKTLCRLKYSIFCFV